MGKGKAKASKSANRKGSKKPASTPSTARHTHAKPGIGSLFGPIRVRSKRKGETLELNFPSKKAQHLLKAVHPGKLSWKIGKKSKNEDSYKKKAARPTFVLNLPESIGHPQSVPWMKLSGTRNRSSPGSEGLSKCSRGPGHIIPSDALPEETKLKLDKELESFANYVRLTDEECQIRDYLVEQVELICRDLFEESRHTLFNRNSEAMQEAVRVQVFGSFGTKAVCSFRSDVDLAIWGVVPVQKRRPAIMSKKNSQVTHSEKVDCAKQERKRKWQEALAAVDEANTMSPDPMTRQNQSVSNEDGPPLSFAPDNEPERAGVIDQEESLFVIDRFGDVRSIDRLNLPKTSSINSSSSVSLSQTIGDNSGAIKSQGHFLQSQKAESHFKANSENPIDDLNDKAAKPKRAEPKPVESDDESFNDSTDKMEAFVPNRAKNEDRHFVSYSSDDDSHDAFGEEVSEGAGKGDRDLEVSFFSQDSTSKRLGPTGLARQHVTTCLGLIRRKLQKRKFARSTIFIKTARVPIVKMTTSLGFESDIAIGGHNGSDTSPYAGSQTEKYRSFAPVVLALKVVLQQTNLDEPFAGGLGSYKLYVLVAYHIEQHLLLGGNDRPSEIFLGFLFRYGAILGYNSLDGTMTHLQKNVPVATFDASIADLSNVFLLEHCVDLFGRCWRRLWKRTRSSSKNIGSFLADIVDVKALAKERQSHIQRAKATLCHELAKNSNSFHKTPVRNFVAQTSSTRAHNLSSSSNDVRHPAELTKAASLPREATAAELLKGYNVQIDQELPTRRE